MLAAVPIFGSQSCYYHSMGLSAHAGIHSVVIVLCCVVHDDQPMFDQRLHLGPHACLAHGLFSSLLSICADCSCSLVDG